MRRRRYGGRRRRLPVAWVPAISWGLLVSSNTVGNTVASELIGVTPVNSADPPVVERLRVERITGDVPIACSGTVGESLLVIMAFMKGTVIFGSTPQTPDISLASGMFGGGQTGMLYVRSLRIQTNPGGGEANDPFGVHFDFKPKCTLREGEMIRLLVAVRPLSGAATLSACSWSPCLRCLISKIA